MIQELTYFDLKELVCPHVYEKYKQVAWQFFDSKLLITLERIRELLNKQIFVNNWDIEGKFSQRGFRCIQCEIVKKAIAENRLYVSPHMTGQGVDFDVEGLLSEEVRQWIIKKQNLLPYPVRLENGTSWIHLDSRDAIEKVHLFNK